MHWLPRPGPLPGYCRYVLLSRLLGAFCAPHLPVNQPTFFYFFEHASGEPQVECMPGLWKEFQVHQRVVFASESLRQSTSESTVP